MISIDIVTPDKKVVEAVTTPSVVLPTATGELEILPGHTELLTRLGTGVLVFQDEGTERYFAVSEGFAEVRKNRVVVLAESCEEGHQIDATRAKAAQDKAEGILAGSLTKEVFDTYQLKLQRAIIRQQAASRTH